MTLLHKYKQFILYGLSLAALLFLLQWFEYRFIVVSYSFEIYIGFIAVLFTSLGIWLAIKLTRPKIKTIVETVIVEKEIYIEPQTMVVNPFVTNEEERLKLGLSNRELEVLNLMSEGLSNQEIADSLFVSLNTIKTHTSKLFEKMEVKRRTQAVEKAKRLNIIR